MSYSGHLLVKICALVTTRPFPVQGNMKQLGNAPVCANVVSRIHVPSGGWGGGGEDYHIERAGVLFGFGTSSGVQFKRSTAGALAVPFSVLSQNICRRR